MTREDFKKALAEKTGVSQKEAKTVLDTVLDTVVTLLKGEATTTNKEDFKKALAESLGTSQKEAKGYLDAFLEVISENLRGEDGTFVDGAKIQLTGFGTFLVKSRKGKDWKITGKDGVEKTGTSEDKLVVTFKKGSLLSKTTDAPFTDGAKIQLTGFGTFAVKMKKGKEWKLTDRDGNVRTGKSADEAAVSFKVGSTLKA